MGDALARAILGTASLALLAGAPRVARGDAECARVSASTELAPAWADAVADLKRQLAAIPSAESQPLTLSIEPVASAVRIVALADDGRRVERRVGQPAMLVPIALGLVISIPADPSAETAAPQTTASASPPAPPSPSAVEPAPPAPVPVAPSPMPSHATAVRLGVALGGRFGVPSTISMIDLEARADLRVDRLLLFASFENVPFGFVSGQGLDADAYRESSIALGLGRTIPVGSCALDLAGAPSIVTMRLSRDAPNHARADDVELRVGISARLDVPLSKSWDFTITADTDVIPDALRSANRIDPLPAFPAWTSGLRVGASGALL